MTKLIIFDVDGTLTPDMHEVRFPDSVVVKLINLRGKGIQFALASNQGGVGYRYWVESAGGFGATPEEKAASLEAAKNFPIVESAWKRLSIVASEVTMLTFATCRIYCCYAYQSKRGNWAPVPDSNDPMWSQSWRKPNPGMLLQAAQDAGIDIADCLFVGNEDTDREAAAACGMAYTDAKEFFLHD